MLSSGPEAHGLLNEFWKHIHHLLRRMSSRPGASDHGNDALQSAVRTLLNAGDSLYFRTEVEFLGLLSKRTKWKEASQYRKRRPGTLDTAGWAGHSVAGAGTAALVSGDEGKNRFAARLMKLSESDRKLVLTRLSSSSSGDALDTLEMNDGTGRRALNRAMERFRRLIDPGAA
jgi:DNA-directed RNA polymerase specialized sigma24 family protein